MHKFISLLICSAFFLYGCQQKPQKTKTEAQEIIPVRVMPAKTMDLSENLEYVGNIKAQEEAIVYPKVSGKIIEKVKDEGSPINKGETLIYIDRDEVGLKFERAPVESPLSGIIGRVYVDIGQNVNSQTPVALVVDMDKVKIGLDLPEKYFPDISLGQRATVSVDAYPEEQFSGEVTKISPVVDLATRTAPIEISVGNSLHHLKSGMFAKAELMIREHKNTTVILKEAVMGKDPDTYVYTIENKKAALKKVTLGLRQGAYLEVKEGIKAGELVVVLGQQRLTEGTEVQTEVQKE